MKEIEKQDRESGEQDGMPQGFVKVVGIGVGNESQITPEVSNALYEASDAIGYIPYIERLKGMTHLKLHPSDNRVELEHARIAFCLAETGRKVVIVSSGDPGVFAMASALFEVMEQEKRFHHIDVEILPGISAMFAAAAKLGAPLGHDFCAINLSTHLKPFAQIEKRVRHAAKGDFVMAFYNPRSQTRPDDLGSVLDILREELKSETLVIYARNVTRPDEHYHITTLKNADPKQVDMRSLVFIGNQNSRQIKNTKWVYTPRYYDRKV